MAPKGRLLSFTEKQTLLDGAEEFGELVPRRSYIYIHTYIHTYALLSVPERGFSASVLK